MYFFKIRSYLFENIVQNYIEIFMQYYYNRIVRDKEREIGGTKMKVQNITNIEKFFSVVDSCEGRVELVTGEGDRLNLKSKLSQYVSLANIFSDGQIGELEIVASEPADVEKLVNFMING